MDIYYVKRIGCGWRRIKSEGPCVTNFVKKKRRSRKKEGLKANIAFGFRYMQSALMAGKLVLLDHDYHMPN